MSQDAKRQKIHEVSNLVDGKKILCDNGTCNGGRAFQTDKSYKKDASKMFCCGECADEWVRTVENVCVRITYVQPHLDVVDNKREDGYVHVTLENEISVKKAIVHLSRARIARLQEDIRRLHFGFLSYEDVNHHDGEHHKIVDMDQENIQDRYDSNESAVIHVRDIYHHIYTRVIHAEEI